jgi:hypothetical protein
VAYVGNRFFPSTLATPTTTTLEIDIPATSSRLVARDLAVFFAETFRILATDRIRTGREAAI